MAVGFRSTGTVTRADVGLVGSPRSVSLPFGHVSGDWLFMTVICDDNTGPTSTPAGWTFLGSQRAGSSRSPSTARPHVYFFHRFDTGSLGGSVNVSFDTADNWSTGKPFVIAWVEAYTGVDTTAPVETWSATGTTDTSAAQVHPQITTATPGDWLITVRASGFAQPPATYVDSVGTDVERVDIDDGQQNGLGGALYDSNTALTIGLQTQRTTTASEACQWGSVMASIAIRPVSATNAAVAQADVAQGFGTAFGATVATATGAWDLCASGGLPNYSFNIDWNGDGNFTSSTAMLPLVLMGTGVSDEATNDIISDVSISYGRDQDRQLNPAAVGSASFSLINVNRKYSPEWFSSVLFGNLEPARPMRGTVTWGGTTFPLFFGRIDDFNVKADMTDRSVDLTFLDAMNDLSRINLSTEIFQTLRTGEIIDAILDEVGWTAGRDIDLGATIVKYWWADATDALSAINDLVKSEGAPSIAYVSGDGTFVFHDRHHRIQNQRSITSQATYAQPAVFDCTAVDLPGYDYTAPFNYAHGWRDIINSVSFSVQERNIDPDVTVLWTNETIVELASGESQTIDISSSDPFLNAVTPVSGVDYNAFGAGVLTVSLSRDSGVSTKIILTAVGGPVSVHDLQLRGQLIPVERTIKVSRQDSGSISVHGERTYPDEAPWANANDADAIAGAILLRYAQRRPTVEMRVVTKDPSHFLELVTRTVGDRIHITNGEMGLDDDFFVERITHTITRFNQAGHAPVHSVIFGCEKATIQSTDPFRFDVRGAGFDQGVFDPINADSPFTVFMFDLGVFDTNVYGT